MKKFSVILLIAVLAMSCVFAETTAAISGSIDATYTVDAKKGAYNYAEPASATGASLTFKLDGATGKTADAEGLRAEVGATLAWTPAKTVLAADATGASYTMDKLGSFKLTLDTFALKYKGIVWDLTEATAVGDFASATEKVACGDTTKVKYVTNTALSTGIDGLLDDNGTTLTWNGFTFTAAVNGEGLKKEANKSFYTGVETPVFGLNKAETFTIQGAASFGYALNYTEPVDAVLEVKNIHQGVEKLHTVVMYDSADFANKKADFVKDAANAGKAYTIYDYLETEGAKILTADNNHVIKVIEGELYYCYDCGSYFADKECKTLLAEGYKLATKLETGTVNTATSKKGSWTPVELLDQEYVEGEDAIPAYADADYFVIAGSLALGYTSDNIIVKAATDQSLTFGKVIPAIDDVVNGAPLKIKEGSKVRYDVDAKVDFTFKPVTASVYFAKEAYAKYATSAAGVASYCNIKNLLDAKIVVDLAKFNPHIVATFDGHNLLNKANVFNTEFKITLDEAKKYTLSAYANDILTSAYRVEELKALKDEGEIRYMIANFKGQQVGVKADLTFGDVNIVTDVNYGIVLKRFAYAINATYKNANFTATAGVNNIYTLGKTAKEAGILTVKAGITSSTVVKNATVSFDYASKNLLGTTVDGTAQDALLGVKRAAKPATYDVNDEFGPGSVTFKVSVKF